MDELQWVAYPQPDGSIVWKCNPTSTTMAIVNQMESSVFFELRLISRFDGAVHWCIAYYLNADTAKEGLRAWVADNAHKTDQHPMFLARRTA